MTTTRLLGAAALLTLGLSAIPHAAPAQARGPLRTKSTPTPTATATLAPTATATATATPTASPTPAFAVTAWVQPAVMPYNSYPTLYGSTRPGATCMASVVYDNGYRPVSFSSSQQTVPAGGVVGWGWHEETTSTGGVGTVTCADLGQTRSATARFTVTH